MIVRDVLRPLILLLIIETSTRLCRIIEHDDGRGIAAGENARANGNAARISRDFVLMVMIALLDVKNRSK